MKFLLYYQVISKLKIDNFLIKPNNLFVISQYFCERSKNVWTCRLHWCIIIYVIKIIVRHFVNKSILLSLLLEKSIINFIYKICFYNTWKQIQIIKNFSCLTIFFYKYNEDHNIYIYNI